MSFLCLGPLAVVAISCGSSSREIRYRHATAEPGVVYVAEQVHGLEEWVRGPESRSYARIYTRAGDADEGQLVRITADAVVLTRPNRKSDVVIGKDDVLFMRVWW